MGIIHKHRIIPGHMGGKYTANNVVLLTTEQHAEAHKKLYEEYGKWQDFLAWKMLSGQIGKEEAKRQAIIQSNKTRIYTKETKEKLRQAQLGKKLSKETKELMSKQRRGKPKSEEHKIKIGLSQKGRIFTEEHKLKMRKPKIKRKNKLCQ